MRTDQLVSTFVEYYEERGHRRITGSTLLPPDGDPVLFTTSGMHPLTPYLEGRPHPLGRRLVNVQRCLRTTDLDEVGDATHLTVFEMLGTWSLGDYEGPRSLDWGYGLLTEGLGIDPGLLYATAFAGDGRTGPDTASVDLWQGLGVPVELTVEDNWWPNDSAGPCGPDSEIFLWTGDGPPQSTPTRDDRWVEVWNHVTMTHRRLDDGSSSPSPSATSTRASAWSGWPRCSRASRPSSHATSSTPGAAWCPPCGRWTNLHCAWSATTCARPSWYSATAYARPTRGGAMWCAAWYDGYSPCCGAAGPRGASGTCRKNWSSTQWTTSGRTCARAMRSGPWSKRSTGSAASWSAAEECSPSPGSKAR